jgi:hypothetical protein
VNWLHFLGLYAVLHLPALFVLYALWVQHERGGWCKVFYAFGGRGFLLDVVANYTTLALIFGWPGRAVTFSKRLKTLCQMDGWRGRIANQIADVLDGIAPSGNHIHR